LEDIRRPKRMARDGDIIWSYPKRGRNYHSFLSQQL